jgi:hypothetical protein
MVTDLVDQEMLEDVGAKPLPSRPADKQAAPAADGKATEALFFQCGFTRADRGMLQWVNDVVELDVGAVRLRHDVRFRPIAEPDRLHCLSPAIRERVECCRYLCRRHSMKESGGRDVRRNRNERRLACHHPLRSPHTRAGCVGPGLRASMEARAGRREAASHEHGQAHKQCSSRAIFPKSALAVSSTRHQISHHPLHRAVASSASPLPISFVQSREPQVLRECPFASPCPRSARSAEGDRMNCRTSTGGTGLRGTQPMPGCGGTWSLRGEEP